MSNQTNMKQRYTCKKTYMLSLGRACPQCIHSFSRALRNVQHIKPDPYICKELIRICGFCRGSCAHGAQVLARTEVCATCRIRRIVMQKRRIHSQVLCPRIVHRLLQVLCTDFVQVCHLSASSFFSCAQFTAQYNSAEFSRTLVKKTQKSLYVVTLHGHFTLYLVN